MLTLVIDTASNRGLVGLVENGALLGERAWPLRSTYSQELLFQIEALLAAAGVAREALSDVAVNVGPGGYGSLRVGVATAQGLALGLGVPLAGVVRLEADAVRHLGVGGAPLVVAVHQAGASGIAWAAYARPEDAHPELEVPHEIEAPRLGTIEECATRAPVGALWCGELMPELRAALDERRQRDGTDWTEAPPEENMRRALDIARLARGHEAFGDPADVDVLYLRPPSITQPRD